MTTLPNPPEVICVPQHVAFFATPATHEYAFCDVCSHWTPQEYCHIAEENACGICHASYTEDYHA